MAQAKKAKKKISSINKVEKEISKTNSPQNDVVEALQTQLANAFIIYLNYKHYHWQSFGPLFRDLHMLFEELGTEVFNTIDELAERVRMIGQNPVSHIEELVKTATVRSAQKGNNMREMIAEANDNAVLVIKEMRQAIKVSDDNDDPGTADLFTKFVQIHEKQEWFLRDILEKKDGLTM